MPSHREQVIIAIAALVRVAIPKADHRRNNAKPERLSPEGYVNVEDGDPGDPEVIFSPTTYIFDHVVPVEIAVPAARSLSAETRLDDMLKALDAAIEADRTLGGLCDYLRVGDLDLEALTATGAATSRSAVVGLVATYGTTSPLN